MLLLLYTTFSGHGNQIKLVDQQLCITLGIIVIQSTQLVLASVIRKSPTGKK